RRHYRSLHPSNARRPASAQRQPLIHTAKRHAQDQRLRAFPIAANRPAPSFNPAYMRSPARSPTSCAPATSHNPPDSRVTVEVIQAVRRMEDGGRCTIGLYANAHKALFETTTAISATKGMT